MLGVLDAELFPNSCEVVEMPLYNQFVYLIQKNGNSSIRQEQRMHGYPLFSNEQIFNLDRVDVYIRNPKSRYVSGVNTYLQHLQRDYPELDYKTAVWFAKRYKFLNRHYLPQFHWIYNLSRFMNPDAKIRFRNFADFKNITKIHTRSEVVPPARELVDQLLVDNAGIELWWYLDQILLDLAGSEMSWKELVNYIGNNFPDIEKNVLSKT